MERLGRAWIALGVKSAQGRTDRISHQKCLMLGSRWGKLSVRTREAVGLAAVRYDMRLVVLVATGTAATGSGVEEMDKGDGAWKL